MSISVGDKFSRLKVVSFAGSNKHHKRVWECTCVCGGSATVTTSDLNNGHTQSCGCFNLEIVKETSTTHGLSKHPLRRVWVNINSRCYNKTNADFSLYGAKGVTVCELWKDLKSFVTWALAKGWEKGNHIHRIGNSKLYSPDTCEVLAASDHANTHTALGRKQSNNKTGYVGVSLSGSKFASNITVDKDQIYLGVFCTPNLAVEARNKFITDNNLSHPIQGTPKCQSYLKQ